MPKHANYRVKLSKSAASYYQRLDTSTAQRLDACFEALENDPFDFEHHDIKRLWGKLRGRLRYRVGRLRVVYKVDQEHKVVYVEIIAPRGNVY